jgi:hypothetical protein
MTETELIVDGGRTFLGSKLHERVAQIGKAALDAVFIAFNRRPQRSLWLFFNDKRIFMSIDGEKAVQLEGFPQKYVTCVLEEIGLSDIWGAERDVQLCVSVDV